MVLINTNTANLNNFIIILIYMLLDINQIIFMKLYLITYNIYIFALFISKSI